MIPQYVVKMLEQRRNLALKLADVSAKVDEYCEKIGIDINAEADNIGLASNVMIYCEPCTAYERTKNAIEETLGEKQEQDWLNLHIPYDG